MRNIWTIVCKNSLVDRDTNSLSLLESLDQINILHQGAIEMKKIKLANFSFQVVSLWFDEDSKKERVFKVLTEIIDPKHKKLKYFEQECIFPINKKRLRVITKINGFGFTTAGVYKIRIRYKLSKKSYQKVAEIPIDLNIDKKKG